MMENHTQLGADAQHRVETFGTYQAQATASVERAGQSGIGDINSDAVGSGARYNTGKPAMDLIPIRIIADSFAGHTDTGAVACLEALADFQEQCGDSTVALMRAVHAIGADWSECAHVFEYGKKKYAAWNWAKGMAWSVPLACAVRHIAFCILAGEELDKESGRSHRGHVLCNLVMLLTFLRTYPEGDDRPALLKRESLAERFARHGFPIVGDRLQRDQRLDGLVFQTPSADTHEPSLRRFKWPRPIGFFSAEGCAAIAKDAADGLAIGDSNIK